MITYEKASEYPESFQQLFGCSVGEFDALYAEVAVAHIRRKADSTLTRKNAISRQRKPGAGRRYKHELKERLLLTLFWLQVYPTLVLLGRFFELDKTSAEDNLKDLLATLETLDGFTLEYPRTHRNKLRTLQQVLAKFPDAAPFVGSDWGHSPAAHPTIKSLDMDQQL